MALRDPGAPRRNPLFAVDPAAPGTTGSAGAPEQPLDDGAAVPEAARIGSALGPLAAALQEAGPEAAEHLVTAAHELTLAVKVVVDALERGLAEQRELLAADGPAPAPDSPVQRIDVE
jgi:hypothetical protein